jgi:hypothetical protein
MATSTHKLHIYFHYSFHGFLSLQNIVQHCSNRRSNVDVKKDLVQRPMARPPDSAANPRHTFHGSFDHPGVHGGLRESQNKSRKNTA